MRRVNEREKCKLTADVYRRMESLGYLRVHFNQKVLLLREFFIAILDLGLYPTLERLTQNGVSDVDQPLTWDFVHIPGVRKVVVDSGILSSGLEYSLNRQCFVLRNVHDFYIIAFNATGCLALMNYTYNFFFPMTRSFKKQMVRLSQWHKYALTSTVRKTQISLLERNLDAKVAAVTAFLTGTWIYIKICFLI